MYHKILTMYLKTSIIYYKSKLISIGHNCTNYIVMHTISSPVNYNIQTKPSQYNTKFILPILMHK